MDTSIDKSDVIPLIILVWLKSFARKGTNKNAIRDRGWYPANRKLLQDHGTDNPPSPMNPPDGTGRRTNSNPSDTTTTGRPTNLVTTRATDDVSDVSIVSESSSTTTAASATRAVLDDLNFDSGVADDFTLDILQHPVKKESVCDNLHNRYEDRRSLRNPNPTLTKQGDLPEEPSSK